MAAVADPTQQALSPASQVIMGAYNIGLSATTGALAGWAFNIIAPAGGAVFGVAYGIASSLAGTLANYMNVNETATKTALRFLSFAASLAAAAFVTGLAGFPLTLVGAVGLSLAMIPSWFAVACSAGCIGACATGCQQ